MIQFGLTPVRSQPGASLQTFKHPNQIPRVDRFHALPAAIRLQIVHFEKNLAQSIPTPETSGILTTSNSEAAMDWNGKHDRQALKRIVALLFAFATLAELAGARPRPVRAAVLWLLRAAEAIGRDFVSAVAEDCGGLVVLLAQPSSLDVADDSARLAHSFRALAELLGDVMRWSLVPLPSGWIGGRPMHDLMLNLGNLAADRPARARSTLEPSFLDSS